MVFLSKVHIQAWSPAVCEAPSRCKFLTTVDALNKPPIGKLEVCGIMKLCPAHAVPSPAAWGKLKWVDGNWKDARAYIQYQRNWFRWVNYVEWIERAPKDEWGILQPMPAQLSPFSVEPQTTGTVAPPPQEDMDDLNRAYGWAIAQDAQLAIARQLTGEFRDLTDPRDFFKLPYRFEGQGDTRALFISPEELSVGDRRQVQDALDIQFGPDIVTVEA